MKKIFMAIVAVLFAAPSFAQYSSGGFSLSESSVYYGMRLGLNVSSVTGDFKEVAGSKAGLNLGGVIGLRVSETTPIFLESGLYYTQRGGKKDKENYVNLNYLEIPILMKYGVQVSDDIAVLPFIGPTFALGIAGQTKHEGEAKHSSYDDCNRADVGIKLGCGAEYNKLYLELGYQFGITNVAKEVDNTSLSAHNGAFFVNIGMNF